MARWSWTAAAIAVITSTLLPIVSAQSVTLLPSSASDNFPACALSCPLLKQAQDGCVPPAAPKTSQSIYVSCFCQSTLLTTLHSQPNGVCDDTCPSASDRSKLMEWYNNYCSSGGEVHDTPDNTSPGDASTSSTSGTPASAPVNQATSSGPPSWWSTHYQWVIMIIILAIGFTVIAVGGMYLKRRHDAKNPGLYHGADGSNSTGTLFSRMPGTSTVPGSLNANQFAAPPRRADHVKSDSIPSEFTAPREGGPGSRTSSRLMRSPQPPEGDDPEIREIRPS